MMMMMMDDDFTIFLVSGIILINTYAVSWGNGQDTQCSTDLEALPALCCDQSIHMSLH